MTADDPRPTSVPDPAAERRRFLWAGGAGAVAAALLGACGQSSESGEPPEIKAQQTGTTTTTDPEAPPPTVGPKSASLEEQQSDLALLRTLTSVELAAANAYGVILTSGETGGVEFINLTNPLRNQHEQAARALQQSTRSRLEDLKRTDPDEFGALDPEVVVYQPGRLEDPEGNAFFWNDFVAPRVEELDGPEAVLTLAQQIEEICAATQVLAAGTLTTAPLRAQSLGIAAVEARATAVIAQLHEPPMPGAPDALFNTRDAIGTEGQLTYDGSPEAAQ